MQEKHHNRVERLTFHEAVDLLEAEGYVLCSQVNFSYGFYHPNNPRQSLIVITAQGVLSKEMTKRVYEAVNRQETIN